MSSGIGRSFEINDFFKATLQIAVRSVIEIWSLVRWANQAVWYSKALKWAEDVERL